MNWSPTITWRLDGSRAGDFSGAGGKASMMVQAGCCWYHCTIVSRHLSRSWPSLIILVFVRHWIWLFHWRHQVWVTVLVVGGSWKAEKRMSQPSCLNICSNWPSPVNSLNNTYNVFSNIDIVHFWSFINIMWWWCCHIIVLKIQHFSNISTKWHLG